MSFINGELVLLYTPAVSPGLASKLQYKWDGPFRVTGKVTPVTYQLKHVVNGKNVKAHVQRLCKFHQRQQNDEDDDEENDDIDGLEFNEPDIGGASGAASDATQKDGVENLQSAESESESESESLSIPTSRKRRL